MISRTVIAFAAVGVAWCTSPGHTATKEKQLGRVHFETSCTPAAQKLFDAARILEPLPQAMQLRYLATLFDIAGERSSTVVFPFPIDLMQAWTGRGSGGG